MLIPFVAHDNKVFSGTGESKDSWHELIKLDPFSSYSVWRKGEETVTLEQKNTGVTTSAEPARVDEVVSWVESLELERGDVVRPSSGAFCLCEV